MSVLFGYKVVDGKTVIDEMVAEQVKTVFREYLQGASLSETAQKAKIFVSHGSIVNMLRNGHYLGDKYYPAIIDQNTFLKVQEERSRRAIKLGRVYEPNEELPRVGYHLTKDIDELNKSALPANSEFVSSFGKLSKELGMSIGITFLEAYQPLPRNTLCLFDRFGNKVLTYAKVHTCDFGDESLLTAGDDFYVVDLDTSKGIVKIGGMICYDREFPESARILMLKGAEIILVPNACPMEINRISQLRSRAYENMVGIATVNYPIGQPDCNGHSTAFDGMAYKPSLPNSRDTLIMEAGEQEGIYLADFPVDEIREYRSREVHGNAYRHPRKYQLLVSEVIKDPFIREDCRI